MHKFLNFILVLTVLISGFVLYSLEHRTRGLERDIVRAERVMSLDLWLGGATALGLLIYLVAVLARPERF